MKPLHFADNRYRPAMQFHEIARVLGISTNQAQHLYRRAMRKIANHPAIHEALGLAAWADRMRTGTPLRLQRSRTSFAIASAPQPASELREVL